MDILTLIEQRQSSRGLFDPDRKIPEAHLRQILEGARWAPTAHNMQNVDIVVIIGFHIQSVLSADRVEQEVRRILAVPDPMKIGFAVRLGYPATPGTYLRVRRDVEDFTHRNRFEPKRP